MTCPGGLHPSGIKQREVGVVLGWFNEGGRGIATSWTNRKQGAAEMWPTTRHVLEVLPREGRGADLGSVGLKWLLIWGSIECALATKIGGEAKAHEISNTQKGFG